MNAKQTELRKLNYLSCLAVLRAFKETTNHALSIKELVSEICNITNTKFEEIVQISSERLGKDQTYLLNSNAIREKFGWKDTINLKEGLFDTISWIEKNIEVIKMLSWEYQHKE